MPPSSSRRADKALRFLVLTFIYAVAIAVAVIFSPANGFIHAPRLPQLGALSSGR